MSKWVIKNKSIDEHGVGGGGISYTPSKDFEKLNRKNAIKHENRGPPPIFSHNPKYLPQNNLKMTASMNKRVP
jgi:hypothetical protein